MHALCARLPQAREEPKDFGFQYTIRRRIFVHVFAIEDPGGRILEMLAVRVEPDERAALLASGHPYFMTRGANASERVGVVLDRGTDWDEIAEPVTESYRLVAPPALAAEVSP